MSSATELSPVWHALADPTRRQILDLLRIEPRTTGQLADKFPSTRFAVMKHLTVLEEAGLVVVRRLGRERWNHLNAVPLKLLYERWVKPYEAVWAQKLTALKSRLEEDPMQSKIDLVEMEISINAPKAKVWKALIHDTTFWWPKNFYTSPKAKSYHIEAKLGGRMYEDWGDGAGLIWYRVFGIDAPDSIHLEGCMAPPYGPAHNLLVLRLEENNGATVLKLSDTTIGNIDEKCDKQAGWKELFEGSFKPYAETHKCVNWAGTAP